MVEFLAIVYAGTAAFFSVVAITDGSFSAAQSVWLGLSWPVWLPRVFTGGA